MERSRKYWKKIRLSLPSSNQTWRPSTRLMEHLVQSTWLAKFLPQDLPRWPVCRRQTTSFCQCIYDGDETVQINHLILSCADCSGTWHRSFAILCLWVKKRHTWICAAVTVQPFRGKALLVMGICSAAWTPIEMLVGLETSSKVMTKDLENILTIICAFTADDN